MPDLGDGFDPNLSVGSPGRPAPNRNCLVGGVFLLDRPVRATSAAANGTSHFTTLFAAGALAAAQEAAAPAALLAAFHALLPCLTPCRIRFWPVGDAAKRAAAGMPAPRAARPAPPRTTSSSSCYFSIFSSTLSKTESLKDFTSTFSFNASNISL